MAPEQVQGDALRVATDIYSVGVIFFEILTGQLPFKASSPALAALKRLHEPAPRVRSIDPRISATLDRILAKALQHRPQDRYQSARAMLQDVNEYLARGDRAEASEPTSARDLGVESEPEPSTTSSPYPNFGDEETTLVTGRSYRSARVGARSEPPASLDNSLPVLAATTPPVTAHRPRRLVSWLMIGAGAVGLVLLTLAIPLGKRSDQSTTAGAPVTIGIGLQEPASPTTGIGLRPGVNSADSLQPPTEIVGIAPTFDAPSTTVTNGPSVSGVLASQKKPINPKPAGMIVPLVPLAATRGAANTRGATNSDLRPSPSGASVATSATSTLAPAATASSAGSSAGLIYPPGVKKPALVSPSDAPGVQ
jgi:serine/threonine protein kinase